MRCLVLGGAGFIGSHIINSLIDAGHIVRLFDIKPSPYWSSPPDVECFWADWNNSDQVYQAAKDMDVVVHLICTALPGLSSPGVSTDLSSNLLPTLQLLQICQKQGLKKIIFLSSGGTVYGYPIYLPIDEAHPTSPISSYGVVKLMTEKYLQLFYHSYNLEYIILRGANIYGENHNPARSQGVINVFLGRSARSQTIEIWGEGLAVRDFLYVGDMARAVQLAIESDIKSDILNVGSGVGTSINQLIIDIQNLTGKEISLSYKDRRDFDVPANILAINKIGATLGWHPEVSLTEGIHRTWDWIRRLTR